MVKGNLSENQLRKTNPRHKGEGFFWIYLELTTFGRNLPIGCIPRSPKGYKKCKAQDRKEVLSVRKIPGNIVFLDL